jgi:hypothetical protein
MTPTRRSVMKLGAASALSLSLPHALARAAAGNGALFAGKNPHPARACILLYMAGGPSHIDTFDPKPGRKTGGPFKAIPTTADGVQIGEHLPRLAAQMKHVALVRSLTAKEGNHDRARHLMHTGYAPAGGANHPAFGALVAEAHDHATSGMPGYVAISGPGEDAGFLPANYSPFPVASPQRPVRHLGRARGVDAERFDQRLAYWRQLEDGYASGVGGDFARSHRAVGEQAAELMRSKGVDAFRLDPSDRAREPYGKSDFGAGCLMARRLVEASVPFVEVTLNGWDTHEANFERVRKLCDVLDQGMSALLSDLQQRGLLSSTLVIWMGDFGRTPHINDKGGRDHHPACSSVLLAGGGIKGGQAIGSTDEDGTQVRDRPVTVPDLYRTIASTLDLNPDKLRTTPAGRPLRSVDGGSVIAGLL